MDKKKRQRSENWNSQEKKIHTELIKEKIDVIEDKRTDTNTSHRKREAWNCICKCFNEVGNVQRTLTQMQFQWRNTKMRLKAQDSAYKKECHKTGGGPKPESPSPEDLEIVSLIPLEFEVDCNKFDNDYDSDDQNCNIYSPGGGNFNIDVDGDDPAQKSPLLKTVPEKAEQIKNAHIEHPPEESYLDVNDYSQKTTVMTPVPQKRKKRKNFQTTSCEDEYKKELFLLAKGNLIEEHAEKMKTISMIRELRLKCIQEEHDAAMKSFSYVKGG